MGIVAGEHSATFQIMCLRVGVAVRHSHPFVLRTYSIYARQPPMTTKKMCVHVIYDSVKDGGL